MDDIIKCVNITEEAKDDFFDIYGYEIDLNVKSELNYYLGKTETNKECFKVKYLDEEKGINTYFFLKKGKCFADIQTYNVIGVCKVSDVSEDFEQTEKICSWLKTTYNVKDKEPDWVEVWRLCQIEKLKKDLEDPYCEEYYRNRGVFEKLPDIFQSIAAYLSDPSQGWETFAKQIRKLTGEDEFGKYGD